MGAALSIGDFSRMTHLSVKALRHYHDVGVLEPAHVDRFTGYRSYETSQISTAHVIRRLRDLQMPLDQIRSVLTAPDLEARNREIAAHLARMEAQLAATRVSVAALRRLLEGPPEVTPVTYRRIPAAVALGVEEMVDVAQASAWGTRTYDLIRRVRERLGLATAGAPGALFPSDYFELERGRLTAFVPVEAGEPRPALPEGPVRWHEIPALDAAVALHDGALGEIDRTYGALGSAVAERLIGTEGPIREYFLVGAEDWDDPRRETEVCWPISKEEIRP